VQKKRQRFRIFSATKIFGGVVFYLCIGLKVKFAASLRVIVLTEVETGTAGYDSQSV